MAAILEQGVYLKEKENMYSVFLSSYRNTHKTWKNLKKLWKDSPAARSPKLPPVFLFNN